MDVYILPSVWILTGLVLLIAGGEVLVRGASVLAAAVGVSPLIIGLTVVAFGTSAPELAVNIQSAWSGQADLAMGNVIGSNIANVLLILGLSALIAPLVVASQLIRFDVPLMIAASVAMLAMGWDESISRWDGCILFSSLLCYTTWLIRKSRQESDKVQDEFAAGMPNAVSTVGRLLLQGALLAVGFVLLGLGSRWLVHGAVEIARLLHVRELIIGLTVVSLGTSLPEVVTSIVASLRGQRDIAVGNVVGSNLFNILCVLGLSSIVAPEGIAVSSTALRFDIPVMIAVAVACLPIFFTGNLIARWEGGLFFGFYLAYTTYLILAETSEAAITRTFGTIMIAFVIPLTVITLVIGVVRTARDRGRKVRKAAGEHGPDS